MKYLWCAVLLSFAVAGCQTLDDTFATPEMKNEMQNRKERTAVKDYRAAIPALLQAGKCDELAAKWEAFKKEVPMRTDDLYFDYGTAIAKCGKWSYVVEEFVHWGGQPAMGVTLMGRLNGEGLPVKEEILKYLRGVTRLGFKNYQYATRNITDFFYMQKWDGHGAEFMKIMDADAVSGMKYMRMAKYRPAVSKILGYTYPKYLSDVRKTACITLGDLGDRSALARLRTVAAGDPDYAIVQRVKVYPVRDAAKAAIYKLSN